MTGSADSGGCAMKQCLALKTGVIAATAAALIWGFTLPAMAAAREATVSQKAGARSAQLFRWEQETAQPPVEQVGEGTSGDAETLDQGPSPAQAPPAQEQPPADVEPLD